MVSMKFPSTICVVCKQGTEISLHLKTPKKIDSLFIYLTLAICIRRYMFSFLLNKLQMYLSKLK